jgi:hypothetical protein
VLPRQRDITIRIFEISFTERAFLKVLIYGIPIIYLTIRKRTTELIVRSMLRTFTAVLLLKTEKFQTFHRLEIKV